MKFNRIVLSLILLTVIALISSYLYQFVFLPKSQGKNQEGCLPTEFKKEIRNKEVYILWKTKEECTGYVKYGTTQESFPYYGLDLQGVVKIKEHEVKLSGVELGSSYYLIILSNEKTYGIEGLPIPLSL